ncbi:hypothetical protein [Brevibacterium aurantiacum]|uniref:hypothetical protein n=1 Tax=Brevibacterium aurantiacum TaxID=273384 RepID=UPI001ABEE8EC|nr:hypothetical protein [Brevibacterium aurantiacum]
MAPEKRGQGILYEIAGCPSCNRAVKVSLVDGEIYSHQVAEWSVEVCEQTGTRIKKYALGVEIGKLQSVGPGSTPPETVKPFYDKTSNSIKPIYIGKHHQ